MFFIAFTRVMKGPFDLVTTTIGVSKPVEDTDRKKEALVQGITQRIDFGVGITTSSSSIDLF